MDQDDLATTPTAAGAGPARRPVPAASDSAKAERARREEREAAALRQNLLRRKAQARKGSGP